MSLFYIYTTYTEVLRNILVQHVKNPIYYTTYRCMVYLQNKYTILTNDNSILRSIWINITQLIVSFWESAWSFFCYFLALPHFCNTVFGGKSAWLRLRQQSTQPHHVTPALSQCVLFFLIQMCLLSDYSIIAVAFFRDQTWRLRILPTTWEGEWIEKVYISTER